MRIYQNSLNRFKATLVEALPEGTEVIAVAPNPNVLVTLTDGRAVDLLVTETNFDEDVQRVTATVYNEEGEEILNRSLFAMTNTIIAESIADLFA